MMLANVETENSQQTDSHAELRRKYPNRVLTFEEETQESLQSAPRRNGATVTSRFRTAVQAELVAGFWEFRICTFKYSKMATSNSWRISIMKLTWADQRLGERRSMGWIAIAQQFDLNTCLPSLPFSFSARDLAQVLLLLLLRMPSVPDPAAVVRTSYKQLHPIGADLSTTRLDLNPRIVSIIKLQHYNDVGKLVARSICLNAANSRDQYLIAEGPRELPSRYEGKGLNPPWMGDGKKEIRQPTERMKSDSMIDGTAKSGRRPWKICLEATDTME
ncbi:hypothetical protein C8R45DRAFT_927070 [Mycena sanguinolenta]|nr:hypothetical protein C8R45DRAFT_927070 [Mycena sanguinolenta]